MVAGRRTVRIVKHLALTTMLIAAGLFEQTEAEAQRACRRLRPGR